MIRLLLRGLVATSALCPMAVQAEEATPPLSVAFNAAIVSDYHFRGISLSNRHPAIQGGVDLSVRSGFFLGTWASSIADYGGSDIELDLYGGYGGSLAGIDYTASVLGYVYPGGRAVDYVELQSTVAKTVGPVTTTLTLAYTPDQWNTTRDNLYLGLGADVAIGQTPLTASFGIGRENGAYDEKWDWSAGLSWKLDVLEISGSYVDSNYGDPLEAGRNGGAAFVLSVKASF